MSSNNAIRAFSNSGYDYYETTEKIGFLPKGTIFYHDKDDDINGSPAEGCLKLCWTPDGNCYGDKDTQICGGTVIFHTSFIRRGLFKEINDYNDVKHKKQELESLIYRLNCEMENAKKILNGI